MSTKPYLQLAAGVSIVPCLYILWFALTSGIADGYGHDAKQLESRLKEEDFEHTDDLNKAINLSRTAVDWAPTHPDYRDLLARLLTIRYIIDNRPATADEAKTHLLTSRSARPESARNWSAFANLKHQMGEADDEFSAAIVAATRLGPWEADTLQTVTRVGVANYRSLSAEAQSAVVDNIIRGLASKTRRLPNRIADLTVQEAQGWTVDLVQALTGALIGESWEPHSMLAKTQLSMAFWPVLSADQKDNLAVKIAAASSGSYGAAILDQLAKSGNLPYLCPRLPRVERVRRICARAFTM